MLDFYKGSVLYSKLPYMQGLFFIAKIYRWRCNGMRVKITLACSECKQRNYDMMKNKKNTPDRLELNKYCRFCRKHTLHKETK